MVEHFFKTIVIFLIGITFLKAQECLVKSYGTNKLVCVCNSNHCDSIPPIEKVGPTNFVVYTSNRAGLRFSRIVGEFQPLKNDYKNVINVGQVEYQKIEGFGGALTDAVGINIKSLDREAQNNLLKSYFGPNGIEYNIIRVPIGCSDFSVRGYSYDDSPIEDPSLKHFKLADEDYKYKIPILQEAKKLSNDIKLMGVSWTAPKWMKIVPRYIAMFGELKKRMYQSWADYHLRFLEEYDKNNLTFWSLSTGNEPSVGFSTFAIPSVAFSPSSLSKWIANNLGPTIRKSKYSNVKLIVMDDERTFLPFLNIIFHNKATLQYVDGIGIHFYFDKITPTFFMDITHNTYPTKFMMMTEACRGQQPFEKNVVLGSWERGEDIADGMIENFMHWSVGWMDWNMALNEIGGPSYVKNYVDSPIIVNATAGEFYKQPMFYFLGHFSKFIPVDSVRLKVSQFNRKIKTIAFKRPDGGIVIIIVNKTNYATDVIVKDKVKGQMSLSLTARSITTTVFW